LDLTLDVFGETNYVGRFWGE